MEASKRQQLHIRAEMTWSFFLCSGYEPCSSVLHFLESGEKMVGNAVQQAVSIVNARR